METDFSSSKKRRELAARYVKEGMIQGYLAYREGRVVGWCNTNAKSDRLHCLSWLRFMPSVNGAESDPPIKIKSAFCFVIAPALQRKGVATQLLRSACEDAANEGFDYRESYPKKEFASVARDFMGPIEMYRKCGFIETESVGGEVLTRKKLYGGRAICNRRSG